MIAFDLSFWWANIDPQEMVDHGAVLAAVYTGNARPDQWWIDQARAAGLGIVFIHQDDRDDWRGGYSGGVRNAQRAEQRVAERGYPESCPIIYAISDRNFADPAPWAYEQIAEHARGLGDGSSRSSFIVYSNALGIEAAVAGSPKCIGGWIPSTWGVNDSHLMVQHAGNPGTRFDGATPVNGTDLNTIQHPFPWWGGSAVLASRPQELGPENVAPRHRRPPTMFIAQTPTRGFWLIAFPIVDPIGGPGDPGFESLAANGVPLLEKPDDYPDCVVALRSA